MFMERKAQYCSNSILSKLIHRFNPISIKKIPADIFTGVKKVILSYIWISKGTKIAKTILKKRNKAVGLTLPNFRLTTKIHLSRHCRIGERQLHQWNSKESPVIVTHIYTWSTDFAQRCKGKYEWRKDSLFVLENWTSIGKNN